MWTRCVVLLALALAGCFDPAFKSNIACSVGGDCPPGMRCGDDNVCRTNGGGLPDDAVGPAGDAPADAVPIDAPPDAPPLECKQDADCTTPPEQCLTGGTCNLTTNTCEYVAVDCSIEDDECNVGVCDKTSGACVAQPANVNALCGAGLVCQAFPPCGGYSGTCDSTGTQSRNCTRNACNAAGVCAGTPAPETAACTRTTNGTTCGSTTITNCGACGNFAGTCGNSGTQTCTRTDYVCQADGCVAVNTTITQACSRNTDGAVCAADSVTGCTACDYSDTCDESAGRTCTCSTYRCGGGACQAQSTSCAQSCSRNTDGAACGCAPCGGTGNSRKRVCQNSACTGLTGVCGVCGMAP